MWDFDVKTRFETRSSMPSQKIPLDNVLRVKALRTSFKKQQDRNPLNLTVGSCEMEKKSHFRKSRRQTATATKNAHFCLINKTELGKQTSSLFFALD